MTLEEQISARSREIHTDGYAMSLGEVMSLYRDGDLDVHPEFQRIFRWNESQKSRLIESILLRIPIPPIFVSQRDDGVWDVIDGVQRLSTIFEFLGIYRDQNDDPTSPSVLRGTEYLPALEGQAWEEIDGATGFFSQSMRRDFKRSKLEFRIIRKESDVNAKYDLFQRLNAGSQLSKQEVRNCLLVMLNKKMFETVSELANDPQFVACVPLSEAKEEQAYRQELVLRFFTHRDFSRSPSELREEHGEYITKWMREAAASSEMFESKIDAEIFRETFIMLDRALGEDAFRRWDAIKERHVGPFSIASFEFVTAGILAHREAWANDSSGLADKIREIWSAPEFRNNSGTGMSPRRRVPRLITEARAFFAR
ncbi:MAG: hypothetical protein QG608_1997 [Actinomycetota bacterium]|nr:hypothetical protein [Actinomycetota bacterium]